jgi:hypothetical protein
MNQFFNSEKRKRRIKEEQKKINQSWGGAGCLWWGLSSK